jgi:16S rRNA (cytosine1402-N4)-methyltransferase
MKRETRHIPVLMDQVLEALSPQPEQVVVDCTLGLGGHSAELLRRVSPGGRLIAVDFDPKNIELATPRLHEVGGHFSLFHNNFAALPTILAEAGIERVDGILADLGVASPQIDDPARGFSYKHDGPLDMRMDPTRGQPASALINRIRQDELERALIELGDEEDAAAIAELVIERRKVEPIQTCAQLTQIVCDARDFTLQRAAGAKLHPAARTFQALRILVNRELANLERLLAIAPACLNPGGAIAIISFHSGEDRIVKDAFKTGLRGSQFEEISDEPIIADEFEREGNPRSRSAKLRWARTQLQ